MGGCAVLGDRSVRTLMMFSLEPWRWRDVQGCLKARWRSPAGCVRSVTDRCARFSCENNPCAALGWACKKKSESAKKGSSRFEHDGPPHLCWAERQLGSAVAQPLWTGASARSTGTGALQRPTHSHSTSNAHGSQPSFPDTFGSPSQPFRRPHPTCVRSTRTSPPRTPHESHAIRA